MNDVIAARKMQAPGEHASARGHERLRILHVISGLTPGGAETVLFRLISNTAGIEHEVICLGPPEWYSEKLQELGVAVHHVGFAQPLTLLPWLFRVHRLIKASTADVIQCWMYRGNVVGGLLGRISGKPVLWNVRCSDLHVYPANTRFLARVGGLIARWVPRRILNCSASSQQLHARIGYGAAVGAVVPNGYDSTEFHPDDAARVATRKSLGVSDDTFFIGMIGRWHLQKGYPLLFRALRLLRDRGVPLRLLLIGRELDASNADFGKMVEESGCSDVVDALGYRSDAPEIARSLDLHILSSIGGEGFPNVVAETMLSGTPNAATDVGDTRVIVGDTGWIVPPGDADALAAAIDQAYREWSASPRKWKARRDAARSRIVRNFSLERMVEAYEDVWRQVAAEALRRKPPAVNERRSAAIERLRPKAAGQPLRVLHVINDLGPGGAETLLYRLVTQDSANEHRVISLGPPAWYSSRLKELGVPLDHLNMTSPASMPGALLRLHKIIRGSGADVVQCWMYRSNVLGGLVAKAAGKPVVWGIHCSSLEPLKLSSRALARLGGFLARWNPDFIINCSTRSAQLHRRLGYAAAPGQVVPNGYDPGDFYPDESGRLHSREEHGIAASTFLIGSVARWHPQKDIPNLLRAVRLVHDAGVPIYCLLIGHELRADNTALMDCIRETGCDQLAVPLWVRNDVPDLARAMDLHVLASSGAEAFPNVVAETMLCGTPNVVTDVGDSAVIVGDVGWVVEPRNSRQLADAIIAAYGELTSDPGRWSRRRAQARERIVENFTQERMIEAYVKIWREVLSSMQAGQAADRSVAVPNLASS